MYRKYATPLRIDLQASDCAGWWLLLTHASGLLVLPFTGLPAPGMALIAAIEMSVLLCCWPRYVSRRHRSAIRVFTWKDGDKCIFMQVDGKFSNATLAPNAFIMPWLVILYFRQGKRARSLFILPDMLSRDAFRRLRVRLRTELGQQPEPAQA